LEFTGNSSIGELGRRSFSLDAFSAQPLLPSRNWGLPAGSERLEFFHRHFPVHADAPRAARFTEAKGECGQGISK